MSIERNRGFAQPRKYEEEIQQKVAQLQIVRAHLVDIAVGLVGAPSIRYRDRAEGLTEEGGFDCSGFVCSAIERASQLTGNVILGEVPRHANEQWRSFGEPAHYLNRQAGDLVYFASKKIAGRYVVGHVGIVVDRDQYVHSPGRNGEVVEARRLPDEQEPLVDATEDDIYSFNPVGLKRLSMPLGDGRWGVY